MTITIAAVVLFAIAFEFINGFHDTANAIATTVYTRALKMWQAIALAACMNFVGALVSSQVAKTITSGLVAVQIEESVVLAALIGAIAWNLFTWLRGIPSSSSHALLGSLIGATLVYAMSPTGIQWDGVLVKIIIPLVTSPIMGFIVAFVIMKALFKAFASVRRAHANAVFHKLQIFSAAFMAFSHGTNDAQKTMGIITLALIAGGLLPTGADVPVWCKVVCALAMAAGTAAGGKRVMHTMGTMTKLEPAGGFTAEVGSALVIEGMSALGAPISTPQVISTAVMGIGAARRFSSVKWQSARNIVLTWLITLPAAVALGALAMTAIRLI
jgi:PiT family inorganic phosphate transporter